MDGLYEREKSSVRVVRTKVLGGAIDREEPPAEFCAASATLHQPASADPGCAIDEGCSPAQAVSGTQGWP